VLDETTFLRSCRLYGLNASPSEDATSIPATFLRVTVAV